MKRDELNAVSRSRVYDFGFAQVSRGCCVVRCIGPPVFDVLDERAQLREDLASARIV